MLKRCEKDARGTIAFMIIDGLRVTAHENRNAPYIAAFLSFIERRLGVKIVRDMRSIPYGRADLADVFHLAELFKKRGVITSYSRAPGYPDEPRIKRWFATCNNGPEHIASGANAEDDRAALFATLGEGLERYLWTEARDHFVKPIRARTAEMRQPHITPERFAGYSAKTREQHSSLLLSEDASYLWIQGQSHITKNAVYIPAQTVSGARDIRNHDGTTEPIVRVQISTGVATWATKEQAILSGALEVIERDAYMITWLNQITPKRVSLESFKHDNSSLSRLIARCEKYQLRVHALRLVTDAPTYAIGVILEDLSGSAPRFAIGLKANRSMRNAIEGAIVEALRARQGHRKFSIAGGSWDASTPASDVGHYDRIYYWGHPDNAEKLEYLITGEVLPLQTEPWENDTAPEHLARIVEWCRTNGYEFVSVSLGTSALNPTSWHAEIVVIPELQPTHLVEKWRQVEGSRVQSVPRKMGYAARNTPYIDAPHPFA